MAGLVLPFLAGVFWAGYILASAHVGQVLPGVDGLAVALAFSARSRLPFGASWRLAAFDDPALLIGAASVAMLSTVIPYGLDLTALRRIPTRVFGVLMSLQPASAAIAGWLVLDQQLGRREIVALVMVSTAKRRHYVGSGRGCTSDHAT